jgi:hypothetical protein
MQLSEDVKGIERMEILGPAGLQGNKEGTVDQTTGPLWYKGQWCDRVANVGAEWGFVTPHC